MYSYIYICIYIYVHAKLISTALSIAIMQAFEIDYKYNLSPKEVGQALKTFRICISY